MKGSFVSLHGYRQLYNKLLLESIAFIKSTFFKYFLTYICIFAAPFMFFSTIIYFKFHDLAVDNTRHYYTNKLQEVKMNIDRTFKDVSSVKQQIEYSKWLSDLYFTRVAEAREQDPYFTYQIEMELRHLVMSNPNIFDIAFKFDDDSTVFSSLGNYRNEWISIYGEKGNAGEESADNIVNGNKILKNKFIYSNLYKNLIIYNERITNSYSRYINNRSKGDLRVYINQESILKEINKMISGDKLLFMAVDTSNEDVLIQSGMNGSNIHQIALHDLMDEIESEFIVLQENSDLTELRYMILIPNSEFLLRTSYIKKYFLAMSLISLLICLILSIIFSKKNYNPIKRLVQKLSSSPAEISRNEMYYIDQMVSSLIKDKNVLEEEVVLYSPYVKQHILKKLLQTDRIDSTLMLEISNHGIEFPYKYFCVIILEFPALLFNKMDTVELYNAIATTIKLIQSHLKSFNIKENILENDSNSFILITNLEDGNIRQAVEVINSELAALANVSELYLCPSLGVGSVYDNISGIRTSCKEALNALKYKIIEGKGSVIYYDDVKTRSCGSYYYPIMDEFELINSIKEGDFLKAEKQLGKIMNENIYRRDLNASNARFIYYEIVATVMKTMEELHLPQQDMIDFEYIDSLDTLFDIHEYLKQILHTLCNRISQLRSKERTLRSGSLIDFVDENCFDSKLSLNIIADKFNVSMSYVSKLFQNLLHMSFSEYVNKKRIDRAVEMINNGEGSLQEISRKVGYDRASTFRENFRRFMGVLPGLYQERYYKNTIDKKHPGQILNFAARNTDIK